MKEKKAKTAAKKKGRAKEPKKVSKTKTKKAKKKSVVKKKTVKAKKSKSKALDYTIVNLVASANLNATLDLYNLAITIPNVEYEPEQFPGAILKLKEPKVSMLLFKNGKVICSGASSEKEIELGIKKASKLIHEIQPKVKVVKKVKYTVVNLVATANLNMTLDLFRLAMGLDNVEYEPEQFPGAILRMQEPKITLLLFKNGKVICAGAKHESLLRQGLENAVKLIKKTRKARV